MNLLNTIYSYSDPLFHCALIFSNSHVRNISPLPEVDNFVSNLIKSNNGYIRKFTMPKNTDLLLYELAGDYKFCENIGRHHKSNNVRIVVDLKLGQYYQTCHDPDCQHFK